MGCGSNPIFAIHWNVGRLEGLRKMASPVSDLMTFSSGTLCPTLHYEALGIANLIDGCYHGVAHVDRSREDDK